MRPAAFNSSDWTKVSSLVIWIFRARPSPFYVMDEVEAALDDVFLQLELGYAITQQAADAIGLLEQGHVVARARELLRRQYGLEARADRGHAFGRRDK